MDSDNRSKLYSSGVVEAIPVIRGTRVSLLTLVGYLEKDRGLEAFLADHPQVTPAQLNRTLILGLQALLERRKKVPGSGAGEAPG